MRELSAENVISSISHLKKNVDYNYINPKNSGMIHISRVESNGPIYIKRYNPLKGSTLNNAKEVSISKQMIKRYADAFEVGRPVNIDRILGASYSTRSALESLLAYTPEFYYCYPGRIYDNGVREIIEKGQKHLVWLPDEPHLEGCIVEKEVDTVISEIPQKQIIYDALYIPETLLVPNINIEVQRRHIQIQIALYFIGLKLNYRIWIARNDKGVIYQGKRLCEFPGMVTSLNNEPIISAFTGALNSAMYIDCIWFKEDKWIPAIMEVEDTTGIKTGLDRLMVLRDCIPSIETRYIIVARDEEREKVIDIARKPMYQSLDVKYLPYSAVEELYWICTNRNIGGTVKDSFIDCFMETI